MPDRPETPALPPIPFSDFGGQGAALHFLHANGYPPGCYQPFTTSLSRAYHAFGMHLRPLWPGARPEAISDWNPFSDDLIRFLGEAGQGPVIGVGHSIGAQVTLRSALRAPGLFRALVLLEPVLFPHYMMLFWQAVKGSGLGYQAHPLIRGALKRRREFATRESAFERYRPRKVFRYFSDDNLRAFIAGMTRPKNGGGYELVFDPEWEAHIYYTGIWHDWDIWDAIEKLEVPTLILRGAQTDTFWESTGRAVRRRNPAIQVESIPDSTHLLPLERPQAIFESLQCFLKEAL
jgi:pimeloyl-ACP methyl ester carboxylesterase